MRINPQELIPSYWYGIYVPSREKFIFLGSKNLQFLKQYWRREERVICGLMKARQAQIDLLNGKTIADVQALAIKYEHPDFPSIGYLYDNREYPEPLDRLSRQRKPGATTFNYCGWCKYCDGGTYRLGYHVVTGCSFIPELFNREGKVCRNGDFRFNTPCLIANGTQEFLDDCVEYLKAELSILKAEKAKIGKYLQFITEASREAEDKPYLASFRPASWFELGEEVVCFISDNYENAIKKNVFVTGRVIDGYRHGDGYLTIYTDDQVLLDDFDRGHVLGFGKNRPEVMRRWEYEYFKVHPDFFKVWLRASVDMHKLDSDSITKALHTKLH